jgi:anti-sigma-K factor RskA
MPLTRCSACRQEVQELQAAAADLGAGEALAPPSHLKHLILAAAELQPQLPPLVAEPPDQALAEQPGRPLRSWGNRLPQLLAAAAAAVLVAVAGFGVAELRDDSGRPTSTLATDVVRVFEASDARQATLQTSNGAEVAVATAPSLNRMAVDTQKLPDLEQGSVYQLWAVGGGTYSSAGLLEDPARGAAMEMPAQGVVVAITIEPAGGSVKPTDAPILTVTPSEV